MGRSVTVEEILRRATKRADQTNSNFYSPQDKLDLLNEAYPVLYDVLVQAYENYYVSESTISIDSTTFTYDLPDDFYKLIGIDLQLNGSNYITLTRYNEIARNSSLANQALPTSTVRVRYVPTPQVFTSLSQEIDGVSGWDAILVTDIAIMMMISEESSTASLERVRAKQMQRILEAAQNRDTSLPATVSDIYAASNCWTNSLKYRLYGDQITFKNDINIGVFF